jgi:thiol:disulfide interchange protein DsbA
LVAIPAFAQTALKEGVNYTVVKPAQPTDAPAGKVEVIEFFGYWCPHCNEFDPTLKDWAKRNDAKVQMVYVPVPLQFRASETALQKLYYTLDAMGKEKELRGKVFSAIHADQSLPFNADVGALATWAEKNGIDKKKFIDTFNSFSVQSKVNRANQLASAYGVTGVPELGMGGKYLLTLDSRSIGNADVFLARVQSEK